MKRLYDTSGHLKPELVQDVLNRARLGGKLPNVSKIRIAKFAEKFAEEMSMSKLEVGKVITPSEVKYLTRRIRQNKHDNLRDRDIQEFEDVILDLDASAR